MLYHLLQITSRAFLLSFYQAMFATGSVGGFSFLVHPTLLDGPSNSSSLTSSPVMGFSLRFPRRKPNSEKPICNAKFILYCSAKAEQGLEQSAIVDEDSQATDAAVRQLRRSADWKAARAYNESGAIYEGRVEGSNSGGLLVRFYSLLGFLPFPLLSPSHSCKEPQRSIQEIAKDMVSSIISVKVTQASEENRKLIFSEKDALWDKFSGQVNVGDVFDAMVGSVEDYGAFVHLRFPDGNYHLTGLVHVSEVSWDLVQAVRDILSEGDEVKVKVIQLDREKSRIALSIKQLEDDPLMETLDKVISQDKQFGSATEGISNIANNESLPGLESICEELLLEDGITEVRIGRQGFEKRVVSQDLELWLSNAPAEDGQFTLLARAGRQVQEIHLTTSLDQEDIKRAVQRVSDVCRELNF